MLLCMNCLWDKCEFILLKLLSVILIIEINEYGNTLLKSTAIGMGWILARFSPLRTRRQQIKAYFNSNQTTWVLRSSFIVWQLVWSICQYHLPQQMPRSRASRRDQNAAVALGLAMPWKTIVKFCLAQSAGPWLQMDWSRPKLIGQSLRSNLWCWRKYCSLCKSNLQWNCLSECQFRARVTNCAFDKSKHKCNYQLQKR